MADNKSKKEHPDNQGRLKLLEIQLKEFSRNYLANLELLEKSSDEKELLDKIFDEYIERLDELKGLDLHKLQNGAGLEEEREKFKSLIMYATQAAIVHDKARLYQKLDKANRELREVNNELDKKNRQLNALNEHYLNMLSFASHELRSPLISILGYAELMADRILGELSNDQEEAVEIIIKVSKNLIDMIRNYLDLTRIETGELKLKQQRQEADIETDIIKPVLFEMSEQFNKKKMTVRPASVEPVRLDVDQDLMRIVFSNVFSNAVKYGREGTEITYCMHARGDGYLFSVTNQGVGVRPEKVDYIFDKFTQAMESQQIDMPKGTGLGLFISRNIVKEHGGRMWAESEYGKWFTVYFSLPGRIGPAHKAQREQTETADVMNMLSGAN